ncbi:ribonuclease P 40kDa subunit-domain-containing protein [Lasiosphaeris hirsuta]|uniref:Ribonuclease P 40kDa subunit-domain-containing protein n=1 Tax=Lasiosphaeris hirsuta TaxID=260670 RepID=A0AA40AHG8_9PEZI|nr:ribonuclease P 40kDa subunit-domain-containing protein [Lasiosphaeris hirsuta]
MLSFPAPSVYQASKCFVTCGVMGHLEPKQPPTKGKPWATLTSQDFIHRADLILPQEAFEAVNVALLRAKPAPEFKKVTMSLQDILTGVFFAEYIKKGDVMMLSGGRRGIDNVYSLKHGVLTLFLDKEAYERAGLVGKPDGVKGKRGLKPRWVVTLDLKGDSMFPGKKGFDRLVYAAKNALNTPVTWLFCNTSSTTPNPDPLAQHSPSDITSAPEVSQNIDVAMPVLQPEVEFLTTGHKEDLESFSTEIYEWLSLVRLQSPRVRLGDQIDPFLCRYQAPEAGQAKLCKISWQGFLTPSWSRQTLIDVVTAIPAKTWFSLSTTTFSKGVAGDNSECTILRPPGSGGEYIMWEVRGHE